MSLTLANLDALHIGAPGQGRWIAIRLSICATVVILAGLLKVASTLSVASIPESSPFAIGFSMLLGLLELGLGAVSIYMCRRFPATRPRLAEAWTLLFYAVFVVAVCRMISSAATCGCFGVFQVSPYFIAVVDLIVIGTFVILNRVYRSSIVRHLTISLIGIGLFVGVVTAKPSQQTSDGLSVESTVGLRVAVDPSVVQLYVYDPACAKCLWVRSTVLPNGSALYSYQQLSYVIKSRKASNLPGKVVFGTGVHKLMLDCQGSIESVHSVGAP